MTATCPNTRCQKDIPLSQYPRVCNHCSTGYHVITGSAFHVPMLEGQTLLKWKGNGTNFLRDLDGSDIPGFIPTRQGVVLKLCSINPRRRANTKKREIDAALKTFGLKWTLFDLNGDFDPTTTPKFTEQPGYISRLDCRNVPIGLTNTASTTSQPIRKTKANTVNKDEILDNISEIQSGVIPDFRLQPEQKTAIEHIIGNPGGMTTCVLPTGLGKTLIAHAAALSSSKSGAGPTLMISPTISLIDDQRRAWNEFNEAIRKRNSNVQSIDIEELKIEFITSEYLNNKEMEISQIFGSILEGNVDVLCCSPELLFSRNRGYGFADLIPQMIGRGMPSFSNFIFDEAHILYDWGDSIRPRFLMLNSIERTLRSLNPMMHTTMMSATLAPRESAWIVRSFGRDPGASGVKEIRKDTIREDLAFTVIKDDNYMAKGAELLLSEYSSTRLEWRKANYMNSCSPLLIYTDKPDRCNEIRADLSRSLQHVEVYHGGTAGDRRLRIQKKFQNDDLGALVATSAFGMGVDKPDIWLTGYVGSPYTLREVYQMFGRTARETAQKWTIAGTSPKNGNCIAVFPKRLQTKGYKPDMLPPKMVERIWHSIARGEATDNGFIIFALEPLIGEYWKPNQRDHWLDKTRSNPRETNRARIARKIREQLEKNPGSDRWRIENQTERRYGFDAYIKNSRGDAVERIIRSIIMLEMGGFVEICGIHQKNPTMLNGEIGPSLKELLESDGYDAVIKHLSEVGRNGTSINTERNWNYLVAKVKKPISGLHELMTALDEGLEVLRDWYQQNASELRQFLRADKCIRQGFGPVIGTGTQIESCIDNYLRIRNNPITAGASERPVAACSFCRSNTQGRLPSDVEVAISYDAEEPSLWMDDDTIKIITGRANSPIAGPDSIFEDDINRLPYDDFLCGIPMGSTDLSNNERIISLIHDKGKLDTPSRNKYEINAQILDVHGNLEGDGRFTAQIRGEINSSFSCIKILVGRNAKGGFGFLLYLVGNELYARRVAHDQAKIAYRTLRKKYHQIGGVVSNFEPDFIGPTPPYDGSQTRSWTAL